MKGPRRGAAKPKNARPPRPRPSQAVLGTPAPGMRADRRRRPPAAGLPRLPRRPPTEAMRRRLGAPPRAQPCRLWLRPKGSDRSRGRQIPRDGAARSRPDLGREDVLGEGERAGRRRRRSERARRGEEDPEAAGPSGSSPPTGGADQERREGRRRRRGPLEGDSGGRRRCGPRVPPARSRGSAGRDRRLLAAAALAASTLRASGPRSPPRRPVSFPAPAASRAAPGLGARLRGFWRRGAREKSGGWRGGCAAGLSRVPRRPGCPLCALAMLTWPLFPNKAKGAKVALKFLC